MQKKSKINTRNILIAIGIIIFFGIVGYYLNGLQSEKPQIMQACQCGNCIEGEELFIVRDPNTGKMEGIQNNNQEALYGWFSVRKK